MASTAMTYRYLGGTGMFINYMKYA